LVDAKLLETLETCVAGIAGGAGKAMLVRAAKTPLPDLVVNRAKAGFSFPMAMWLSVATYMPIRLTYTAPLSVAKWWQKNACDHRIGHRRNRDKWAKPHSCR
jgi:hypothetical protein